MFPKLIAFDLDYTLWDLWIDTHVTGPLRLSGDTVVDAHGTPVEFYSEVPGILRRLHSEGVLLAACSRTHAPNLARQALKLLVVPGNDGGPAQAAIELFDDLEIYPGSKLAHFCAVHSKTGVPYEQMLFFDDEPRNREVESLGVTFHLTPTGIDSATFDAGVQTWRRRVRS
ncbi:magnesium-dependent phosphatase-1 [Mycena alexandri]|uniref:Magnesium-dependent phosphatase-1 n=1 Tax=Mycena alexandri TaxID=1745969 RepID=A0AAD6X149_9AGAR|nr:magnesium-dependent phosphatase-1 [Mycena alexandri]